MPEQKPAHKKEHASAHGKAHWSYIGMESAEHWGDLSEQYHACKAGMKQSPVNIDTYEGTELPALEFSYEATPLQVVNNGHTVQVNYAPGSQMTVDGKVYQLLQVHFHTPSEHYVDGMPYPMEAHFVHKAADGSLGVVGVMMKIGEANEEIAKIWANVPAAGHTANIETAHFDGTGLLPANHAYYSYSGSLTTPPCSEGVAWHVLKHSITISREQLTAFQNLYPVNARPVQPLHGRVVKGE